MFSEADSVYHLGAVFLLSLVHNVDSPLFFSPFSFIIDFSEL